MNCLSYALFFGILISCLEFVYAGDPMLTPTPVFPWGLHVAIQLLLYKWMAGIKLPYFVPCATTDAPIWSNQENFNYVDFKLQAMYEPMYTSFRSE
ncbi:hypothetical protein MAR_035734, partial [Mya arenaria]